MNSSSSALLLIAAIVAACGGVRDPEPVTSDGCRHDAGGCADAAPRDGGARDESDAGANDLASIDESLLGPPCESDIGCPAGLNCVSFRLEVNLPPHCVTDRQECKPLSCPPGLTCVLEMGGDPQRASCSP